jgi:GGDEF domain-containing protein
MSAKRVLTRADIMPLAEYSKVRRERRRQVTELKKQRRVEVGPFATFFFENYETMWHQVHEMLFIEKGGEEQIEDELRAYNPLIPQGDELVATVMLEIEDPIRRKNTLARLGGIEHRMYIATAGADQVRGVPEQNRENTREDDNKASSVQFMHFPMNAAQKAAFRTPGTQVLIGFDHPNYGHIAVMPESVRAALAEDLA